MLSKILIIIGYYVVALAGFTAWTYADHATTRRLVSTSADQSEHLVGRFVHRVAILLGVVAGLGAGLLLTLLLDPVPAIPVVLGVSLGDGVVTFAFAEIVLRFWGRWFRTDLLADLRGADAVPAHDATAPDDRPAPSDRQTGS
jgi:xanthosine utilization system XapX-like protein